MAIEPTIPRTRGTGPRRTVYDNSPHVLVFEQDVVLPTGKRSVHTAVRSGTGSGVSVLGLSPNGIVVVLQHEYPPDELKWGIPRGRAQAGSPLAVEAKAVLRRKTGLIVGGVTPLSKLHPDPGLLVNEDQIFYVSLPADAVLWGADPQLVRFVDPAMLYAGIRDGHLTDSYSVGAMLSALLAGLVPLTTMAEAQQIPRAATRETFAVPGE